MILVTGANGRLGRALVEALAEQGLAVRAAAREKPKNALDGIALGPLTGQTDWSAALKGVEIVIHCASLTWVAPDAGESAFQTANVDAVAGLGAAALKAGVRRIVYVSSLSVNGKHNAGAPFRHDDRPKAESAYSQSKLAAEGVLKTSGVPEIVIVRPPRILWPDLSGNLAMMGKLIAKGIPLPFGALNRNARDNVSADNLVEALLVSARHPDAAGETFLVSDQQPLSTRALALFLGDRVGRQPRLLPVPEALLKAVVAIMPRRLLGKLDAKGLLDELTRDLRVDTSRITHVTGWQPTVLRPHRGFAKGRVGEDRMSQEDHD